MLREKYELKKKGKLQKTTLGECVILKSTPDRSHPNNHLYLSVFGCHLEVVYWTKTPRKKLYEQDPA